MTDQNRTRISNVLTLSVRCRKALHNAGVYYIEQLTSMVAAEVLYIPGIGEGCYLEVRDGLHEVGLGFLSDELVTEDELKKRKAMTVMRGRLLRLLAFVGTIRAGVRAERDRAQTIPVVVDGALSHILKAAASAEEAITKELEPERLERIAVEAADIIKVVKL